MKWIMLTVAIGLFILGLMIFLGVGCVTYTSQQTTCTIPGASNSINDAYTSMYNSVHPPSDQATPTPTSY